MPDISMCKGTDCPLKETCYRYTAEPSEFMQSYFTISPIKNDRTCDYYWKIESSKAKENGRNNL